MKLIVPGKDLHNGNMTAPEWWPHTTGDKAVRYKDPDHLVKPGRSD